MFKKKFWSLLLMLTLVLTLAACQSPAPEAPAETPAETPAEAPAEAAATAYPLSVTDASGKTVVIEQEPMKIVSLSPAATEIVYAVGAGEKLVGRTDYCKYPVEVADVLSVGTITEPNIETIASVEPDLILVSNMFNDDVRTKLESLGYKVLDLSSHDTFEGVYNAISQTGSVLNKQDQANVIVEDMKATVAQVEEKVAGVEPKTVYYVVGYGESGDYTAGAGTFIDQMLTMAGGANVANDTEGWKYSIEKLVEKDPEFVICSLYNDDKAGIEATNGYKELTAVKEGRLVEVDNNLIDLQGPRLAQGLLELAKIMHPELF
jgi:iron complex transport system substrate-binding protein